MVSKRGQLTIFIIIGILILAIVGVLLFLVKDNTIKDLEENTVKPSSGKEELQFFLEGCLKDITQEAIIFNSVQGGYYEVPSPNMEYSWFKIPYYFEQEVLEIPKLENVETELEKFIEENIVICLRELSSSRNVSISGMKIQTVVSSQSVITILDLPLVLYVGEEAIEMKQFRVEVPVELGRAIEIIEKIIEEQKKFPNYIRMSYITELAEEESIFIDLRHLENEVVYSLRFPKSEINDNLYVFSFVIKYNWIK